MDDGGYLVSWIGAHGALARRLRLRGAASCRPTAALQRFVLVLMQEGHPVLESEISRNVARGYLLAGMKRARGYLKLAQRYGASKERARDNISRSQLSTLENSYLTLAKSSQVLRRSLRLQKALEKRRGK